MERRSESRVSVKHPCKARFQLGGQSFTNVAVVNLGSHGCCFVVPEPTVNRFKTGPMLEGWRLVHPKLPKGTIKVKVVWCRSSGKANSGLLEAGVQFLEFPPGYRQELDQFLAGIVLPSAT